MSADSSDPELIEIDLNADVGEGFEGDDEVLDVVTSCSIACGGHAGDHMTMVETVRLAIAKHIVVGAHPGYPDWESFGRKRGFLEGDALYDSLATQLAALAEICAEMGTILLHVKPHGALYNDAVVNQELADIVARVTLEFSSAATLIGMAGSALQQAAERHGLEFLPEGFADRAYEADGTLVPRNEPGAVHTDTIVAANQAVRIAKQNLVIVRDGSSVEVAARTLCIHGDMPGAARTARAIREALEHNEVLVRAYQIR